MSADQDIIDRWDQMVIVEFSEEAGQFINLMVDDGETPISSIGLSRQETIQLVDILENRLYGPRKGDMPREVGWLLKNFGKIHNSGKTQLANAKESPKKRTPRKTI
jgi:hypothetical protein